MQEIDLDYGLSKLSIELPDSAIVVRYGQTYQDPPTIDPVIATKKALQEPLGISPLKDLAGQGKTAAIVFPDRVKGGAHSLAHRKV